MNSKKKVIVVAGPTASGKSDFAVSLAFTCNGEIISADSRQVFKGLDIGTGKITQEEMRGIPHYMLSIYDLDDKVSVARYAHEATGIMNDIWSRGKTPIICGGTGQYIDALIFDTQIPKVEPNHALRELLEKKTTEELFEELKKKDTGRADVIDKHNRARLIRALEIVESLGKVPKQERPTLRYPTEFYLMDVDRSLLREKITKRLHKRLEHGMLEECKQVFDQGYTGNVLKRFGLEYDIMSRYFESLCSLEEAQELLITKTIQYAKRQQTWNKKYIPIAKRIPVHE